MHSVTKTKAVLYARVSSKEQMDTGYSIDAQVDLLRAYAKENYIEIVHEYVEVESAKTTGRAEFNKMIKFIKEEKRRRRNNYCRTILVEKTDRFCRNFRDYLLLDELDIDVHFVKEGTVYSEQSSRSTDKMIMGMKVLMAKHFIDNLKEETIKGLNKKAEQGNYPCRAPYGYINVKDGKKNHIAPDPETAPMVKKIYNLYASGNYSLKSLANELYKTGFFYCPSTPRFPTSVLQRMLNNPIYYGKFRFKDKLYDGNHTPLITKRKFQLVNEYLTSNGNGKHNDTKVYMLYRGLIHCGDCGCLLTGEKHKKKYIYYHCTFAKGKCKNREYIRSEVIDAAIEKIIRKISFDDKKMKFITDALKAGIDKETKENKTIMKKNKQRIKDLKKGLDKIYMDYQLARIDKERYERIRDKWEEEIDILEDNLWNLKAQGDGLKAKMAIILKICKSLTDMYLRGLPQEKREILQILFSNFLWDDGKLVAIVRKPLDMLLLADFDDENSQIKICSKGPKKKDGVDDGTRTHNNRNHNPVLCH